MKLIQLFIIFLGSISILSAQSNNVSFEDAYMKCYDSNFKDEGKALREYVQQAEKMLSEANVFKGTSGENYIYFLKNSGRYTSIKYSKLGFMNFMLGQLSAGNFDMDTFRECSAVLEKQEGYESSKMNQLDKILKEIKTANNVQDVTSKVAKILTPESFDHIYYRLLILNFLEVNGSKSLKKPNENIELSEETLQNALKIHIKTQDEIIIKNTTVSFGELLEEVKKYVRKNTSNTLIALKVEYNISKQFLGAIKQQIAKVISGFRDELAMKKHQLLFNELTEIAQEEIKKIYPEKIVRTNF
ncbi:hypothetical protein [uncultured Kordia sp.]|uniref:hypothetical protein n=1 Tax=uncultured Kordia sp. TaxID=507699 RepID=UPI0026344C4B|nr:hypothetical protein [uncultured Kordia sp.]